MQWHCENEAAGGGGSPRNGTPHQSYLSASWSRTHVMWYAQHAMTIGHFMSQAQNFGWMGALQVPQQFNGKVVVEVQGGLHLEDSKNLHLMVPKSRSIIAQQYVDVCAFFHVHYSKSHRKIPKAQNFQFSSFFIRKNVDVL